MSEREAESVTTKAEPKQGDEQRYSIVKRCIQTIIKRFRAYQQKHRTDDQRRYRLEKWALFVAAVYAAITFCLWRTTADTERVSLRAYVVVKALDDQVHDLEAGKTAYVRMAAENEGHTPAKHVTITGILQITTYPLPKIAKFKEAPKEAGQAELAIFNGAPVSFPARTPEPLSQNAINQIQAGHWRPCAWGTLKYQDQFDAWHHTNFCLCYSPRVEPADYCPYHNDSD